MTLPRATRAYGFALLSFVFFSTHDAIIKALGEGISVVQIVFFGSLFSLVPLSIVARLDKESAGFMPRHPRLMALRTLLVLISLTSAFYAFTVLPLSEVYALLFITPLLIAAWSVPLLGEHVGLPRWVAVVVGLAGVLVVLLGDMPLVDAGLIARVAAAARDCPAGAAAARGPGRPGHPVAFSSRYFPQLAGLEGDQGARDILADLGNALALVEAPESSQWDVDTPRDLERIRRHLEERGA